VHAVFLERRLDPARLRRLLLGACAAATLIALTGYGASRVVRAAPAKAEEAPEEIVEITLEERPKDAAPREELEVSAEDPGPSSTPPPPAAPLVQQITKVPEKVNVAKRSYDDDDHKPNFDNPNGGPGGTGSGSGSGARPSKPAPPPPPPPPKAEKPVAPKISPADYDPPKCKKKGIDAARAKALNVEGKVVVTYTVTASGAVTNVSASSGPPELVPLAIAAVQSWQCEPARMKSDGSPVQVTKKVPLTVRLQ